MKHWQRGKSERKITRPPARPRPKSPVIEIRAEAFGCGFDVTVRPPQDLPLDRELPTLAEAVGYAEKLSLDNGWPIARRPGAA